jgi:hypothetical protein
MSSSHFLEMERAGRTDDRQGTKKQSSSSLPYRGDRWLLSCHCHPFVAVAGAAAGLKGRALYVFGPIGSAVSVALWNAARNSLPAVPFSRRCISLPVLNAG